MGAVSASNLSKMDCKYLKCKAQSYTSFSWYYKSLFIFLQMLSTNNLDSPKHFCKKVLNFVQLVGYFIILMSAFMLSLVYINISSKKKGRKRGAICPGGSSNPEMIFALLTEMEAVHM